MMNTAKKDDLRLRKGSVITGKWRQNRYTVIRQLGIGMVGTVYLCRTNGRLVALKMSEQQMSMTAEVNALQLLSGVQDCHLGPFLFEVDDWVSPQQVVYSFYAMEYIAGTKVDTFVQQRGEEWLVLTLLQLLEELDKVHEAGYIFGDLKMEHILIEEKSFKVRCIDVGGMTKIGRSVKEYSELYDRAYWDLGTRKAEPSYDLFAIAMIVLSIYDTKSYKKTTLSKQALIQKSTTIKELHIIQRTIGDALRGRFPSANAMKQALFKEILQNQVRRKRRRSSSGRQIGQSVMLIGIAAFYYMLSFFL